MRLQQSAFNNERNVESTIRHRQLAAERQDYLPYHRPDDNSRSRSGTDISVSWLKALLLILIKLLLFVAVIKINDQLPTPLDLKHNFLKPGQFIAERARGHLKILTGIGPKVTGSYENEVLAIDYLTREAHFIAEHARTTVSYDLQRTTGSYFLGYKPYGFTNFYNGVQNLIIRISPMNSSSALLVNCHYDSVPTSPAGSDDGLNCAVMLEALSVLSRFPDGLKHDVIFLFNGAEETPLQASHGFITQHKWASDVKAFINLEACGAGGRETLFQAGPNHPWLVKKYAESVPHPHGTVLAEDIFQSGLVPSDTDFRIFRDFGKVPGLDFAHAMNGYVYHTKYDDMDMIPNGTFQHTGENLLALIRSIASSEELAHPTDYAKGQMTYFDILGWYMVAYGNHTALLVNIITIFLSAYTIVVETKSYNRGGSISHKLLFGISFVMVAFLLSFGMCILTAWCLTFFKRTMSWYSRPYVILSLYYFPSVIVFSLVLRAGNRLLKKEGLITQVAKVRLFCGCLQLIWTILLLIGTVSGIRSSFVFVIMVFLHSVARFFTSYRSGNRWMIIYTVVSLIPTLYIYYLSLQGFELFIPIGGRMGPGKNPEYLIAALACVTSILSEGYMIPFSLCIRGFKKILTGVWILFFISIILVLFTNIGFPFGSDPTHPTPQRIAIFRVERSFHLYEDTRAYHEAGYWVVPMDPHSPDSVRPYIREMDDMKLADKFCRTQILCGLPVFSPRLIGSIDQTYWIDDAKPPSMSPANLRLENRKHLPPIGEKFFFKILGPSHMTLIVSPRPNINLSGWSFDSKTAEGEINWHGRRLYYVHYAAGYSAAAWEFWLEFTNPDMIKDPIFDIVICTHHMNEKTQSADFKNILKQFPPWAHVTSWTSTYDSFMF